MHSAGGMTMEVQVKLLLQGGHVWQFCCEDDDPMVFGLVSALPGADLAGNLPADGLVQIETRTGERLFLTRSSLVSVEIVPVADPLSFVGTRRLVKPLADPPPGASIPAPFVLAKGALPSEIHQALIAHALSQDTARPGRDGVRELELGALQQPVAEALRLQAVQGGGVLDVSDLAELELRLLAIGDAQVVSFEPDRDGALHLIYHFHKQPRGQTGGGIRLFDRRTEHGAMQATGSFRDVEIGDNGLLVFPGHVVRAGLPVHCPTRAFADSLFVVRGTLRQGSARE